VVEIEKWIPRYIVGFLIYLAFIIPIMANANVDANVYDLTEEQQAVLSDNSGDVAKVLERIFLLTTIDSNFAIIGTLTAILTIIFIITIAVAVNEFIPFPDHYFYTTADMETIKAKALGSNVKYLITTEKDMIKLDPAVFEDLNLLSVSLKGSLKNSENFAKKLLHFIDIRI